MQVLSFLVDASPQLLNVPRCLLSCLVPKTSYRVRTPMCYTELWLTTRVLLPSGLVRVRSLLTRDPRLLLRLVHLLTVLG